MTDDLYPMTPLPTALRIMAESDPPPGMDIERVLRQGKNSLLRRRAAALGGGTAVLAATGLAVGALVPAGSAGHRNSSGVVSAATSPTRPASVPTLPAELNPHDPVATHYGFGYLPEGMVAYGGAGMPASVYSTVWAYDPSGFRLQISPSDKEPEIQPEAKGGPTEKVPATVAGAVQAFWMGYGNGRIVQSGPGIGDFAMLAWQMPGGQWFSMTADNVHARADWEAQALKAAAHVVRQDRSVPLPIKLAGIPQGLDAMGATVTRDKGQTFLEFNLFAGKDHDNAPVVAILAGSSDDMLTPGYGAPPQDKSTCAKSNGLNICVMAPDPEPAALTAIGGAKALLQRITSLGNDPANWTTDVLP